MEEEKEEEEQKKKKNKKKKKQFSAATNASRKSRIWCKRVETFCFIWIEHIDIIRTALGRAYTSVMPN